ncbi:hypothetical protein DFJ77DRAFT_458118 [Powellomyces hirtus]|nr:hypothetical protein DFJ77DRAFT_458118 [Powellomyces hirtus]
MRARCVSHSMLSLSILIVADCFLSSTFALLKTHREDAGQVHIISIAVGNQTVVDSLHVNLALVTVSAPQSVRLCGDR